MVQTSKKPKYIKVENNPSLVRGENNAILNVNKDDLEAYRLRRKQDRVFTETIHDINSLKSEVAEIKSMIGTIIGVLNGKNS